MAEGILTASIAESGGGELTFQTTAKGITQAKCQATSKSHSVTFDYEPSFIYVSVGWNIDYQSIIAANSVPLSLDTGYYGNSMVANGKSSLVSRLAGTYSSEICYVDMTVSLSGAKATIKVTRSGLYSSYDWVNVGYSVFIYGAL